MQVKESVALWASREAVEIGTKPLTVAVAGQPNCGKSTIFNRLTGGRQHVGNWSGKTVECRSGHMEGRLASFRLVDLPGVYSLNHSSAEEELASDFLLSDEVDVLIAVVNAASLRRTMYLVAEMAAMGVPLIIALNMMDVAEMEGIEIDPDSLQRAINCPVVPMSAAKGLGISELRKVLEDFCRKGMVTHEVPQLPAAGAERVAATGRWVGRICETAVRALEDRESLTTKWDRVMLHSLWGRILAWFAAPISVLLGLFLGVLTGGKILRGAMAAAPLVKEAWPGMLGSLFADGILLGLAWNAALIFFIAFTYGIFCFLEDVGYLARIAYFFDGPLRRVGLSGKAAIPMMLGLVCNTIAMAGSRVMDSRRQRLITVAVLPFLPCAGQTFVAAMFIMALFPVKAGLVLLLLLTCGNLLIASMAGRLLNGTLPKAPGDGLIMELPLYHRPNCMTIVNSVWTRIKLFVRHTSGLIMAAVILVWAAGFFPDGNLETSFMYRLGQSLEPFARLMGMDWRFMVALLSSFVAKETTAGTLAVLFALSAADGQAVSTAIAGAIAPAGALAFVVASHLYVPCLATMAMIRSETGSWRWVIVQLALMLVLAFSLSLLTYQVARLFLS